MKFKYTRILFIVAFFLLASVTGIAQNLLDKQVSINVKKIPVKNVLAVIEKKCHFSFSYNSAMVPADSMVSITVNNATVRQVLHMMFGDAYQYKEIDNHIVIQPVEKEKWFTISGYVTDATTGAKVIDASVFERQQLISVLTNEQGYFRLRLKDKGRYTDADVIVSMGGFYKDTSLSLSWGFDHEITVSLTPAIHTLPDITISRYDMEKSWFGRFLLSSQLRKQSANLGKFFVDKPVQASFLPGIGTHGKMSSQVTNKASFNVLGGYAAGVDGVEVGGIFNIDKKDVQYVQVGGIFNIVSGNVTGVQMAGIVNRVAGSVKGVQLSGIASHVTGNTEGAMLAGICNRVGGSMTGIQAAGIVNLLDKKDPGTTTDTCNDYTMNGVQMAGIANITNGKSTGMQIAGIANIVNGESRGMQMAGIVNINRGDIDGVQLSGICNITRRLTGSQIALINIADTVNGYCIGLLNIVKKGYHTVAISSNELMNINLTYKTGNKKLYSILMISANTIPDKKAYSYGFGIGSEGRISNKTGFSCELTTHELYLGTRKDDPVLIKIETAINWNISRRFTLYTGPSVNFIPRQLKVAEPGYRYGVPENALYDFKPGYNMALWVGWQIGFHIF